MAGWWNHLITEDMKGLKLFLSAAVMTLLAAGCAEELEAPQVLGDPSVTFTAQIGEPSTKTVLDYDKKLSMWAGDEYITVLNGQDNYAFWSYSQEPAAVATFSLIDVKPYAPSDVVAMYPSCAQYALDKQTMTVSGVAIPLHQTPSVGTYDVYGAVMMAYTTGNELNFKNAVSLLRFKVKDSGIWNVTVMSNDAQPMTGSYDLKWNNGSPEFEPVVVEGSSVVNNFVSVSPGGSFQVGEYYYVCVAPGTYSKGFTIIANNVECRVTSESKTLERNKIYELGEVALPAAGSWGISGTMTDWGNSGKEDLVLTEEGDWLVYKGLPVGFMDFFQFRADNQWGRQYGFAEPVKAGVFNTFVPDQRHDIFVYEPGIYDVYLAKDFSGFKMEKVGDIDGKPEVKNWGIVGTMNTWGGSADYAMTLEGNLYIARGVTIRKTDEFKFRIDNKWEYDLGGEQAPTDEYYYPVINNYPYATKVQGSNIIVEQSGVYDVYLSCYEDGFRVLKTADVEEEEPAPDPEPGVSGWGLVGAFNSWGGTPDVMLTNDGNYLVVKGIELEGELKFRKDADWTVNFGLSDNTVSFAANTEIALAQDGANIVVEAGIYDVYLDEVNAKAWFINDGSYPGGAAPDPQANVWGIVGDLNGWVGPDVKMTEFSEGLFVAYNVQFPAGGFKIRANEQWTDDANYGLAEAGNVVADHFYGLVCGGASANMNIAAGTYDIWFDLADSKIYVMTPGKAISEAVSGETVTPEPDPEPELTESIWGIVGVVNGWNAPDVKMLQYSEGLFVAYAVEMPDGGFKIRANESWADEGNYGLSAKGDVEVDHCYNLISGGGSGDMLLAAGTYDIWFDLTNSKVYIMTPGKDISEAISSEVVVPDPSVQPWYLVGDFNGWKPADPTYEMTKDGDWYVFKNFNANGNGVKFVADANWTINRGGEWSNSNAAITLYQGGADIYVPAGTYDVYLSADTNTAYFCAPGTRP